MLGHKSKYNVGQKKEFDDRSSDLGRALGAISLHSLTHSLSLRMSNSWEEGSGGTGEENERRGRNVTYPSGYKYNPI